MRRTVGQFILALALLSALRPAAGQAVHALVVADASLSAQWGPYRQHVVNDGMLMAKLLVTHVPEDRLRLHELIIDEDERANPREILAALDELSPGPNDTLIVYYSGHGAADDRGHFFDLAGGALYRRDLREAMAEKGARFAVLLTDCCSARSDGGELAPAAPRFEPPPDYSPAFRSLFIDQLGMADVNGCAPGESAFFTLLESDSPDLPGSLFTTSVEKFLEENRDRELSWDGILTDVSVKVHLQFRDFYPQGVQFAKGAPAQFDQNVYSVQYPGVPQDRGPRAGLVVRDANNQGAHIVEVNENSPARRAWDIDGGEYVSLTPGDLIVGVNGVEVRSVQEFKRAIADSPQVMRVTLSIAGGQHDYLMRLRY